MILLPEIYESLPTIGRYKDGSLLIADEKTLAWLGSNDFYRVSRRHKTLVACDLHGIELFERLAKYFGRRHPYLKPEKEYPFGPSKNATGAYCRMLSPYRITKVPWQIFIRFPTAR